MAEDSSDRDSADLASGYRLGVFAALAGLILAATAWALGKPLDGAEIAYDIGVALVILGVVEFALKHYLVELDRRRTAFERRVKELTQQLSDLTREVEGTTRDARLGQINVRTQTANTLLINTQRDLQDILALLDPGNKDRFEKRKLPKG